MAEVAVADASPLILLSRIGRLDLLVALSARVYVPLTVMVEVTAGKDRNGTGAAVRATARISVIPDVEVPESVVVWDLGAGEAQVIAATLQRPGTVAILDDRAARRCAAALGVPVRGTLGIVTLARQRDRIPSPRPILDDLAQQGMRLAPSLRAAALAAVGESDEE